MMRVEPGTRVLLVRHAESSWNAEDRVQGLNDVPLSDRGLRQASLLALRLAEEPLHAVLSSDLERSRRTAEIAVGGRVPVELEPRVREAGFGAWEGRTAAEIRDADPVRFAAWRAEPIRNRPPGGESLESLQERCMEALAEHLPRHPGKTVLLVAHGGPVRAMVCGLLGLPMEVYARLRVENASLTRIYFTGRGAVLAGFNETAHLRPAAGTPSAPAIGGAVP